MSEFGQSAPATPQIYSNQSLFQFTKSGLTHHICRALKTVGMVPLQPLWSYDALNPVNAEYEGIADNSAYSTYLFPFDFPDASTFEINAELWRPFIVVAHWFGALGTTSSQTRLEDHWLIHCGIRKDGATTLNDSRGRFRSYTTNWFGWGNENEIRTTVGTGGVGDLSRGMFINKPGWKPWASFGGSDQELLAVRNIFCYLGPAGLFVYLGSGSTRQQFGDTLAAGFGFAGARLPGRSVTPDPNLNRINPIICLPMRETETEVFDGTNLRIDIQGMQFDQKSTLDWVRAELRNLENSEIPFYPDARPYSLPSPRKLPSGEGAHILGRVVVIPKNRFGDSADLYGPVEPSLAGNDTRPKFSEVFACPRLRFGDLNAPLGDYQDPDTLDNWRIVPWPAIGMTLGLYSENAVVTSTLDVGTLTLLETRDYDLTAVTATGTSAFNPAVSVPSTPSGASASVVQGTINFGVNTSRWESPAATDLLTVDMSAFTVNTTLRIAWTITLPTGDPLDSVYELLFDARVRGGAEGANGFRVINTVAGVGRGVNLVDPSNNVLSYLRSAGANTSAAAYNFLTYRGGVVVNNNASTRTLILEFEADRTDSDDACVIEIQNIQVTRSRYL